MGIKKWFGIKEEYKPYIVDVLRVGNSVVKVLSDDTIWEYNINIQVPTNIQRWRELK